MKQLRLLLVFVLTLSLAAQDAKWLVFEMDEAEDIACLATRKAWAIELENLRTEDRIATLEGRPKRNLLEIADLESKIEWEDLYRGQELDVIRMVLATRKFPELALIIQKDEKAYLDAIAGARRANAYGTPDSFKAAQAKEHEAREKATATAAAAKAKIRAAFKADCEKAGGAFVTNESGTDDCVAKGQ